MKKSVDKPFLMVYNLITVKEREVITMAITMAELEIIEKGFVELMRTFDLTDEEIATNLGYKLVAE